ncbi:hypothetical protein BH09MYX1_BH09MYX1_08570 [soil metagenome]
MTFASKGILEHLVRGAVGFGAFFGAMAMMSSHPWVVLIAIPVALVALRGCPTCWTPQVDDLARRRRRQ